MNSAYWKKKLINYIFKKIILEMKKTNTILVIIVFLIMSGCGRYKKTNDKIITIDVTKSYLLKKNLILQDFMDVEYIPLETGNVFFCQGNVLSIGEEFILVRDWVENGEIYIFDRNGNGVRKINQKGNGPEEYNYYWSVILDEDNGEIFVNDWRRIIVYDLFGKFKRSFSYDDDFECEEIFNYDKDHLISNSPYKDIAFFLISKHNGSIIKEIIIPFKKKKVLEQNLDGRIVRPSTPYNLIIPHKGNWLITEFSSDTVFSFYPDYKLCPFIARSPSVQSMFPEVMLILKLLSDRYYFVETIKNEFNFDKRTGFSKESFAYDKHEKNFFSYNVYNGDYKTSKEIFIEMLSPLNHEIASWQLIEAVDLIEAYEKGEIKDGKLKEIAEKLGEEDNPVIMLIKHKK